jgi:signal peptidase I
MSPDPSAVSPTEPPLQAATVLRTWRLPEPAKREAELLAPAPEYPRSFRAHEMYSDTATSRGRYRRAFKTGLKLGTLLFLLYGLLFNFSVVRGSSMSPGIHDGDRILVDHVSYLLSDVERGDIVVLQYPLDPSLDYIKRVIGIPGDRIDIRGAHVYVNGNRLQEPYVTEQDPASGLSQSVADGCLFVLGDNRPHSSDSREFGQVPFEYLVGKVDLRVWPPARVGLLD